MIHGRFIRLGALLVIWTATACTHLATLPPPRDLAAEQILSTIKQTNVGLVQFKCVGRISVSDPDQSVRSFRSAIAGHLDDHLRIDMFAPFGGAAGSVASDGKNLFLVLHASREYYKKRFGDGSLHRFIKMDLTVGDLLELLVGRIPVDRSLFPRSLPLSDTDCIGVRLVDRWGTTRQQIILDAMARPQQVLWFDGHGRQTISLVLRGHQQVDGFVLPERMELSSASGQSLSIQIERYEANAFLNEDLFVLPPISS